MLHKYKVLLRHSEQRLLSGRSRLAQRRAILEAEQERVQGLLHELDFQYQLERTDQLDGTEVNRQQLFSWLHKKAADKRRSQDLRLDLQRQEQVVEERIHQMQVERHFCQQMESKRDRYQTLLKQERKRIRAQQINNDEYEIEERFSWAK